MTSIASALNRSGSARQEFKDRGLVGPVSLIGFDDCAELIAALRLARGTPEWEKALATTSRAFFEMASNRALVELLTELIGEDVMLWGASLVTRKQGQAHPWHTDIETSAQVDGSVSVWLGLENTDPKSSLLLMPYSHHFGTTVQERAVRAGVARSQLRTGDVAEWAREFEPRADPLQLEMRDGDAVLFDGRLWHASNNTGRMGTRTALLLQYARPDGPIFMPDLQHLDYPFHLIQEPRPACVMVHGSAEGAQNRIVAPPPALSWIKTIELPLAEDEVSGWQPYPLFNGPTPTMATLSCHVSVLSPGQMPHEPHEHAEDELLILLDGEAELVLDDPNNRRRVEPVTRGSFACYPSGLGRHTIRNSSPAAATYLMLKWRNQLQDEERRDRLHQAVFHPGELAGNAAAPEGDGLVVTNVFSGQMPCLSMLSCHISVLEPGGGYEPHVDSHDGAIVVLSGTIQALGQPAVPNSVLFFAAGEPHGIRNLGEEAATYIVFEFHGEAGRWPVRLAEWLVERIPRSFLTMLPAPVRRFGAWLLRLG